MTAFVTYDELGRILGAGEVPDSMLKLQQGNVLPVMANPAQHYIDVKTKTVKAKPAQPSEFHEFDYVTKSWAPNTARAWEAVRQRRAQLLADSDWTQLPDVPETTRAAWTEYRQQLRDVTQQTDPMSIKWPQKAN